MGIGSIYVCVQLAGSKNRSEAIWGTLAFLFGIPAALLLYMLPPLAVSPQIRRPAISPANSSDEGEDRREPASRVAACLEKVRHDLNHGASVRQVRRRVEQAHLRGELDAHELEQVRMYLDEVPKRGIV